MTTYYFQPALIRLLLPFVRLVVVVWAFFYAPIVLAQSIDFGNQPRFFTIGRNYGLGGIKPTCVYQDSYGFMWIGTWGGLYRFDGSSCQFFEHEAENSTSLSHNFIAYHSIYEDDNHDLWIPTFHKGFVRFNRKKERFDQFSKENSKLPSNALNALCGDFNGNIWLGTRGAGLALYRRDSNSFVQYRLPNNTVGNHLLSVYQSKDSLIWAGTLEGAAAINARTGVLVCHYKAGKEKGDLSASYITDIYETDGDMWFCSKRGLNRLVTPDSIVRYYPTKSLGATYDTLYDNIQRIYRDTDGNFWVGTAAGLLRFDPSNGAFQAIPHNAGHSHSIVAGGIHGIFESSDGNLWFCADGGLSLLRRQIMPPLPVAWESMQKTLPSFPILYGVVYLEQAGHRTFAGSEDGLFAFAPNGEKHHFEKLGKNFSALFLDNQGRLFAGTGRDTFYVLNAITLKLLEKCVKRQSVTRDSTAMVGQRNTCFAQDRTGAIWMGTLGGLNRHDAVTGRYRQFYPEPDSPHSLSGVGINDLHIDRDGNLWVSTTLGLNMLSAAELARLAKDGGEPQFVRFLNNSDKHSLSNNHVLDIFEDRQGRLWVGTEIGLNLYDSGKPSFTRFFKEQGLPENKVIGIVEDKNGDIWVATPSEGIAQYANGRFRRIAPSDGLQARYLAPNGCLSLPNGALMFAGVGGMDVFDPNAIRWALDSVPLYIVELHLFNQPVKPDGPDSLLQQAAYLTREIELDYAQNVVSFQVAALNFTNPEKQVYRYRLEGFKALENWQYLGSNRDIVLTNLFPGTYTLYVESTTMPDGRAHWESGTYVVIKVRYPWNTILLYAAVILATLYFVYKLRLRRKLATAEAHRLRELDSVKTNLYTNITHEFRTPLTVILGEATQLEKQLGENQQSGLAAIRRQGQQLLQLVNEILDIAKVEAGSIRPHWVQGDVVLYLKYLLESFHSLADDKQIDLQFETDVPECWMDYDPDSLQKIVTNLLFNALKFTSKGGQVSLRVFAQAASGHLDVQVRDTGMGIPPEKLPMVFDRYFQADDSLGGTGIGLTLTKELVQLLGGRISVESRVNEGTTFTVTLPVTRKAEKQHFQKEEYLVENKAFTAHSNAPTNPQQLHLPILLLIEDNTDVTRYITSLLAEEYAIHTAPNGREGLEAAVSLVPDLILSDVMMPEMDGFALCRALKMDERTSHIPVVMLTAKADLDSRIEGLEHGADAYLTKPFEERELRVQLRKLNELRQVLRERYAVFAPLASTDNPTFEREYPFFQKLYAVLEQRFSDENFGPPQLCEAMGMGHTNLYRKLTALTGKNIEDYLRSFRLAKAREMLRNPDKLVSEVGWDCGFKDPAHFTKAFRKEFGVPPSKART